MNNEKFDPGLQIIRSRPPSYKSPLPYFHLRVFYIRISNIIVDDFTPLCLTLNHTPLTTETLLEVNGERCGMNSRGSQLLRRDRADKKSEEATFVSTDCVRLSGSVKFEVFDKEELVLHGELEGNGQSKESGRWRMSCALAAAGDCGFLKGREIVGCEELMDQLMDLSPSIEVYVAGCSAGEPVILTRTLQIGSWKKQSRRGKLNSVPENEANVAPGFDLQVAQYRSYSNYKPEGEEDYSGMCWWRTEYKNGEEDGELSWFNAGVRVGVGIGLGVFLGISVGVGLLSRSFRRGLL